MSKREISNEKREKGEVRKLGFTIRL